MNGDKTTSVNIRLSGVIERDMDFLLMRKFSYDSNFLQQLFLSKTAYKNSTIDSIDISRSVYSEFGETDVEVIVTFSDAKRFALLIEDKIDAPAMEKQADRYKIRGEQGKLKNAYDDYDIFIVAPEKYLKTNSEARKYPNQISYEEIRSLLIDPFEIAVIERALAGYGGVALERSEQVTEFWDQIYDLVEAHYPGEFKLHGKRGLLRSGNPGQWISISCNKQFGLQIKSDRGYVDLEIRNYAEKFNEFYKHNKDIIDREKLYIRPASKALAIRKYITPIDFSKSFASQEPALKEAFDEAKRLKDLIPFLRIN